MHIMQVQTVSTTIERRERDKEERRIYETCARCAAEDSSHLFGCLEASLARIEVLALKVKAARCA